MKYVMIISSSAILFVSGLIWFIRATFKDHKEDWEKLPEDYYEN